MNNPEGTEILTLLYKYKNEEINTDNLPDFPLADRNFVKTISQNITDIIYDSYSCKSLNTRTSREVLIDLLKKLIEPNCHVPIDESNYDIFIKCLNKEPPILDYFYQKYGHDYVTVCAETSKLKDKDTWKNICSTVNRKYTTSLENKIKSGMIQTWNKTQFDKINFDFNNPNISFQNQQIEASLDFLNNLKDANKLNNQSDHINKIKFPIISDCNTNIQLAYALLNFEFNSDIEKLLLKIIEDISSSRTQNSAKFVEYIWNNIEKLNLPPSIYIMSLKKFKYLFEKPIISLGTEVLENLDSKSVDYEYEILLEHPVIVNILKFCNLDEELYSYVIFVLNKLLLFSKFDVRIFKLLKQLKMVANNKTY